MTCLFTINVRWYSMSSKPMNWCIAWKSWTHRSESIHRKTQFKLQIQKRSVLCIKYSASALLLLFFNFVQMTASFVLLVISGRKKSLIETGLICWSWLLRVIWREPSCNKSRLLPKCKNWQRCWLQKLICANQDFIVRIYLPICHQTAFKEVFLDYSADF